jgi:hypothetical protein
MRLTLEPEGILETVALASGQLPRSFLLALLGMGVNHALTAAVRLNLFNHLQDSPQSIDELVTLTQYDRHGLKVLLETLNSFGVLNYKDGKYKLTKESAKWLTDSGGFIKDFLRLCGDINRQMDLLEQDIRTGQVPNFHFDPQSPTCLTNYLTMLQGSGKQAAPKLIQWAKLNPPPKRLLDVAGGPGEYSIAFCQQYPNLKADILELPASADRGKPVVEKAELSDRIHYIEVDLLETDWGEGYDLILMSNILHCFCADQCEILLQKAS